MQRRTHKKKQTKNLYPHHPDTLTVQMIRLPVHLSSGRMTWDRWSLHSTGLSSTSSPESNSRGSQFTSGWRFFGKNGLDSQPGDFLELKAKKNSKTFISNVWLYTYYYKSYILTYEELCDLYNHVTSDDGTVASFLLWISLRRLLGWWARIWSGSQLDITQPPTPLVIRYFIPFACSRGHVNHSHAWLLHSQ